MGEKRDSGLGDRSLRHETWLRVRVLAHVSDTDLVDDIVQETWLAALSRPPRDAARWRVWLRRVALNAYWEQYRTARRRRRLRRLLPRPDPVESVLDDVARRDEHSVVRRAVALLDPPYAEVVRRHDLEGHTTGQIAAQLRRPPATVRSQLRRGRQRLRAALVEAGIR